ncbi:hypothetical protein LJK87_18910 [Paenibacillus sp. P25]|nr:hypothetical protein LJK87_18910 [Paenibacillus sp. P25]
MTAGLLLIVPSDRSFQSELYALADALIEAVNRILKMRVTLSIAKPTDSVKRIPLQFQEARLALSYRNFEYENQIIDLEPRHAGEEEQSFQYPFAEERDIIQAMRTGDPKDAERKVSDFLEALTQRGAKEIEVQQGTLNLLGDLEHAIMQSGLNPAKLFKGANLFEQLAALRGDGADPRLVRRPDHPAVYGGDGSPFRFSNQENDRGSDALHPPKLQERYLT